MFAERLAPILRDHESTLATDLNSVRPEDRGTLAIAKMTAAKGVPLIRSILYPPDED